MIPFCRQIDEAGKVLDEMAKNGLKRGENGLQVYVMCEIPNNVLLIDEGIDSISLNPDSVMKITPRVLEMEEKKNRR